MMHNYERTRKGFLVLRYSFTANIFLTFLKAIIGFLGGSQALLTDAVHSLSDIFSTAINMVALRIAGAPPDANHHYGHGRAETVGAKVVALLILIAGIGMGISSINVIRVGAYSSSHPVVFGAALLSFLVKEILYRFAMKTSQEIGSKALEADAKHHRSDALSSLVVVFGVSFTYFGYPFFDPLAGFLVSLLILKMGGELYWQSIVELIDTAPEKETLKQIVEACLHTQGVISINELKARMYGPNIWVDLRICVDSHIPLVEGHEIAHQTGEAIKKTLGESTRVLVHIDPCNVRKEQECEECTHFRGGPDH